MSAVKLFVLSWWNVVAGGVQPAVVVPVDPFQGGELDVVEAAPGPLSADELGFVQAVE
jgi:hypothetical protein